MSGDPTPATRRTVLERDEHRCLMCARPVYAEGAHIHHRLLRSQGGVHTPDNLVTLCAFCHSYVHMHPALSYLNGFMVSGWGDPGSVALKTWRGLIALDSEGGWSYVEASTTS